MLSQGAALTITLVIMLKVPVIDVNRADKPVEDVPRKKPPRIRDEASIRLPVITGALDAANSAITVQR